jgi:phosphoribosylanthranilate isomerase
MLKTNVFAGSISNLTDARYFAARGAQFLTFNLDEATDLHISAEKAAAIKEWVEGPAFVGSFQMASIADIRFLLEKLNLKMIQTGPFVLLENLKNNDLGVPLIRELVIEQLNDSATLETTLESLSSVFDFVFLNFEKTGITWSSLKTNQDYFSLLKNWTSKSKLIIAMAHDPSETQEIIDALNPFGLYLRGGAEEKIGYKSFDELDKILDALEEDN